MNLLNHLTISPMNLFRTSIIFLKVRRANYRATLAHNSSKPKAITLSNGATNILAAKFDKFNFFAMKRDTLKISMSGMIKVNRKNTIALLKTKGMRSSHAAKTNTSSMLRAPSPTTTYNTS